MQETLDQENRLTGISRNASSPLCSYDKYECCLMLFTKGIKTQTDIYYIPFMRQHVRVKDPF